MQIEMNIFFKCKCNLKNNNLHFSTITHMEGPAENNFPRGHFFIFISSFLGMLCGVYHRYCEDPYLNVKMTLPVKNISVFCKCT